MKECEAVAKEIYKALPDATHTLLAQPFKGKIILLSSDEDLTSARKEDVHNNAVFLKPIVRKWPQRVLSIYLYADVIIFLDNLVRGNLLTPNKLNPKKEDVALAVGAKLKKMTSTLRQLARRSPGSWSDDIRELKCLLEKTSEKGRTLAR